MISYISKKLDISQDYLKSEILIGNLKVHIIGDGFIDENTFDFFLSQLDSKLHISRIAIALRDYFRDFSEVKLILMSEFSKPLFLIHSNINLSTYYIRFLSDGWVLSKRLSDRLLCQGDLGFNERELLFFLLNGYNTAFATFINGIYKILPGEIINLMEYDFEDFQNRLVQSSDNKIYFSDKFSKLKSVNDFESLMQDILLRKINNNKLKYAVLFSGGADSTYLLKKLIELSPSIDVTAVFFYSDSLKSKSLYKDLVRVKEYCLSHQVKLRIIDPLINYSIDEILLDNLNKMPFDSHVSVWHGGSMYQIEDDYDLIITGQNADSIYNFGPTGKLNFKGGFKNLRGFGIAEVIKRDYYRGNPARKLTFQKIKLYNWLMTFIYPLDKHKLKKYHYEDFYHGFISPSFYIPYAFSLN